MIMQAYTDGSYKKKDNGEYGVGWCFLILGEDGESIAYEEHGSLNEYMEHRNVAGELYAVVQLIGWCEENGITEIDLHYDYLGVEAWANGSWKRNKPLTKRYREFMDNASVRVNFYHCNGHSGVYGNEQADYYARLGSEGK